MFERDWTTSSYWIHNAALIEIDRNCPIYESFIVDLLMQYNFYCLKIQSVEVGEHEK